LFIFVSVLTTKDTTMNENGIDITTTKVWNFLQNLQTIDITRSEMRDKLSVVNNPDMISFVSLTSEDMNKFLNYWITDENGKKTKNPNPTPNPFYEGGVMKLSRKYKIVTGFDYENSVNNRLEREGKEQTFESDRPKWFEVISKGLVTDRKTHSKFYLRYQYQDDSTIGTSEHFFGGDTIQKDMFESYLVKKDYENQYSNQGLDNTLNFQVCDLNNILYLSIGGVHYRLVGRV
jgi:hypothetical protein